jgi:hypothetical protein
MRCHAHAARAALLAVLAVAVLPCAGLAQSASAGAAGPAPAAAVLFPEKAFEFAPVIDGAKVLHDFVVKNQGSVPLLISDVRTG